MSGENVGGVDVESAEEAREAGQMTVPSFQTCRRFHYPFIHVAIVPTCLLPRHNHLC